ncbi:hypothetical protein K438DRAFT_1958280 [Mycena galopus ATCC 62051]|nr:hypothetical protein K438DRAFT_1958280 [Mycena galopus ATCC 62051]
MPALQRTSTPYMRASLRARSRHSQPTDALPKRLQHALALDTRRHATYTLHRRGPTADARGRPLYAAYAHIVTGVLQVLAADRHAAKEDVWVLRHVLALALAGEDILAVPSAPSAMFDQAVERSVSDKWGPCASVDPVCADSDGRGWVAFVTKIEKSR